MVTTPRAFVVVDTPIVRLRSPWPDLHGGHLVIHSTWPRHEIIWLGLRIESTSEMTMPGLVDLTTEAQRERVPPTAELVGKPVAIYPLSIDGNSLNDQQLNIPLRDVRGGSAESCHQVLNLVLHESSCLTLNAGFKPKPGARVMRRLSAVSGKVWCLTPGHSARGL